MIQIAMYEFKQKMTELGQTWNTDGLTPQLADQVGQGLKQALTAAAQSAYQAFLQSYDLAEPTLEIDGQTLRWKCVSEKTFLTGFGSITLDRNLYQADAGGDSYVPLDRFWGMAGEFATEEVREAAMFSAALVTPEETEQMLAKCAWFHPSATAIKNIVQEVGAFVETHTEELEAGVRAEERIPPGTRVLVGSLDGVNVLLREPGIKRGRPGERPGIDETEERATAYKNAMVGSISFYGKVRKEEECPERLVSRYVARMPEDKAPTVKRQFEAELAAAEAQAGPKVVKVLLLDGFRSLWTYADENERFYEYEKLLDYCHTTEHLSKAGEALFGKESAEARRWYDTYRAKLLKEDAAAESILRSIDYHRSGQKLSAERTKALAQERTFFRRNKGRMTYADFRRRGLPIGSGPVEAACKTIVKTRLCRSGMRWSRAGGNHILRLRTAVKSGRWENFWSHYLCLKDSA
jgi:hypothetical protein